MVWSPDGAQTIGYVYIKPPKAVHSMQKYLDSEIPPALLTTSSSPPFLPSHTILPYSLSFLSSYSPKFLISYPPKFLKKIIAPIFNRRARFHNPQDRISGRIS